MSEHDKADLVLTFHPLTPERWHDLEQLFGPRGACGGCWCMWWRIPRARFEQQKGVQNKLSLKALVDSGSVPGILAYAAGQPVGWCAVDPRSAYPVLNRSRTLRHRGLTAVLLRAAIEYVRAQGGRIVEGYPVIPKQADMPAAFAWTGFVSTFEQVGFTECARRSETRPIMRYEIT
jgi:hypothetical protein